MIKKVVISAAGKGTRMKGLTKDMPKHLIEINGKPFIYYLLKRLEEAGFQEMFLVVGYKKEAFNEFLKKYPFNLQVIDQEEFCGSDYGTAIPIKAAESFIGRENFVAAAGDNLYSVRDLEKINIDDSFNYIGGLKTSQFEGRGVLLVNENKYLNDIIEKPTEFISDIINASLYKFTPEIFRAIDRIDLSPRGEFEITDAIKFLVKNIKVKMVQIEDFWLDFGRPEDIEKLSKYLQNNE
jgi:dTDP-glucose pyrophosphorylase